MNHVIEKLTASERRKWRAATPRRRPNKAELFRKLQEYLSKNIVGLDLNPNLVKATKMNMVMNNDGAGGLYQANSFERPVIWDAELRKRDLMNKVDLILTNPPFGSKIRIDDPAILEQYELAHAWTYDAASDSYSLREPRSLVQAQPPEILFIERCVRMLRPGSGRLAIVLPDAILGAPGLGYVRDWIFRNTRVLASIDLHPDTFQPGNSTQTSLLVLQRKSDAEIELEAEAGALPAYNVFLALAMHVGHDKRGNTTYVRDADGNEVVAKRVEKLKEMVEGTEVEREIETTYKVVRRQYVGTSRRIPSWLQANIA